MSDSGVAKPGEVGGRRALSVGWLAGLLVFRARLKAQEQPHHNHT
jgi:hypothetical protein